MFKKIESLQALRFVAALLVLYSHTYSRVLRVLGVEGNFILDQLYKVGHFGVDIFFVLSGFIMMYTCHDKFGKKGEVEKFIMRRFVRIAPLYWVLTALSVAIIAFAPSILSNGQYLKWDWVLQSFLFLPSYSPSSGVFAPPLGLGWTINFEVYFYFIFAISLLVKQRAALSFLTIFICGSVILGSMFDYTVPIMMQGTSWMLLEFLAGVLLGKMYISGFELEKNEVIIYALSSVLILVHGINTVPGLTISQNLGNGFHFHRVLFFGPAAVTSILVTLKFYKSYKGGFISKLGDASYSIYLSQIFSIPVWSILLYRVGYVPNLIEYILTVMLLCVLSGAGVHYFIEKPLTKYIRTVVK